MTKGWSVLVIPALLMVTPGITAASNGAQVSTEMNEQVYPQMIPDGAGGAIVVWYDARRGNYDIYAQRLSATGVSLWTYNGVPVCQAVGTQQNPVLAADGAGGAIIAWQDQRTGTYDIYAQRISSAGTTLWTFNGVSICTFGGEQSIPSIASDGSTGAIIAWQDFRFGVFDIFAQRIDGVGVTQWAVDGAVVCTQSGTQQNVKVVTDEAGGAIAVWEDFRGNADIYAQRLNNLGVAQWTPNGLPVAAATNSQYQHSVITDGTGGFIVSWLDTRSGPNHIYAQRFNGLGVALWPTDGVALCAHPSGVNRPMLVSDGAGGAIVTWSDTRSGVHDVYAQRVGSGGLPQWTGNGVVVCNVGATQDLPVIASDSVGGAIIIWNDNRFGGNDIYSQRISGGGLRMWPPDGVVLCEAFSEQTYPAVVNDGSGGAIASWNDSRYLQVVSGIGTDIFSQRIDQTGATVFADAEYPRIASVRDVPNDQGGKVKLSWTASNQDLPPFSRIQQYWIWRSVPPNNIVSALKHGVNVYGVGDSFEPVAGKTLLATAEGALTYFWEYVTSQPPGGLTNYSYVASTTSDSVAGSNPFTAFMVQAKASSQWWYSNPDSGYSVDNLFPAAPAGASGIYANQSTTLHWQPALESDFGAYRVYRGGPDFEPGPENLIATVDDTAFVDNTAGGFIYKISTVDVHGNESSFSTVLPSGTTAVDPREQSVAMALLPLRPNPLRSSSVIRFRAAERGHLELGVHDLAGRAIAKLSDAVFEPGEHQLRWNGVDSENRQLPDGLYFLVLRGNGRTVATSFVVLH